MKGEQPNSIATRSLSDVHRTVGIPQGRWWRRVLAFSGPAYMVSVGYMDPGNWATDLEGGASFGYKLIWVLLLSNVMAVLLQTLSARLGLVTGRDLAQACREAYGPVARWVLFLLCELAIAACDLAEVLGTAIGLNLLFGVPLLAAVLITAFDVFLLLAIQRWGIRKMEGIILTLISIIGGCFIIEVFLSHPSWTGVASGFVPRPLSKAELYVAIGIIGATVMPHNLYLHSALVQSRSVARSTEDVAQACKFNLIDSVVALNAAFLVNLAILVVSAATFWSRGIQVTEIQQAHSLLDGLLGAHIAPVAFALALLCAGQSSTVTGTLAGQITMEGFLHFRMRPWLRRMISRGLAITPAVIVIGIAGEQSVYGLLILSQVILSLQLPFAVIPLIRFTNSKLKMGPFANNRVVKVLACCAAAIIVGLNGKLVWDTLTEWIESAGSYRPLVLFAAVPIAVSLALFLIWITFKREKAGVTPRAVSVDEIARAAFMPGQELKRIGVALETSENDGRTLAEGVALAKAYRAELILMHVVEGVGGQWYGAQTNDAESRHDVEYVESLAATLRGRIPTEEIPVIRAALGYGDVVRELVRLAEQEQLSLMVLGGHGHWGLADLWRGQTISGVRHSLKIPVFAVRAAAPSPTS